MKRRGLKKPFHDFTCYVAIILLLSSCIAKNDVSVKVKRPSKSETPTTPSQPVTVSNVQVVNHQIIITGTNLNSVSQFQIKEGSSNTNLQIESQTTDTIVAKTMSNVTFAAGKILDFILSNADAASTFTVNFSLCDSSLGGKAFNCSITPNDKEVLSYDAVSGKWQPRAVNGLSYIGTFDASGGANPAAKPAGQYYIVSVAGDIDAGATILGVGDWIVSNGSSWQKIDNSTVITSVHGRTGAVVGDEGDYTLTQLADTTITAPINNQILKYNGTTWVNSDLSALGGGTVTSVSGTPPITVSNGTSTPAISISQANTTTNGYLSSADWNTFNNKQPPIAVGTTAQYYRGDKSWQTLDTLAVPENTNLYFSNARVLGVPLAGFATDTNAIVATDTVLQAFGKAQGQINNLTSGGSNFLVKNGTDTITGVVNVNTIGALAIGYTPTNMTDATSKSYVDSQRDSRVAKSGDTMTGDLQVNTKIKLQDSGTNTVSLQAPTTITSSYVLKLPTALGTNNQVLTTDAAGNLSWTTPVGGGAPSGAAGGELDGTYPNPTIAANAITDTHIAANAISQSKINGLTTALTGKEPTITAGTTAQYLRGDKSLSTFADDVWATVLTGLSTATNSAIAATDSVLVAFGKLQAQISANTTSIGNKADQTNGTQTITAAVVTGLTAPVAGSDAANKDYVDGFGQWSKGAGANAGDLYRSSKVGIGTATPSSELDVNGTVKSKTFLIDTVGSAGLDITVEDPAQAGISVFNWHGTDGQTNSEMTGAYIGVQNQSDSTFTSVTGINSEAYSYGNATNVYGGFFKAGKMAGGSVDNAYGIYIDDVTGTNTWGVYSKPTTAKNYFGGSVGIGTTAPGSALDVKGTLRLSGATSGYVGFAPAAAAGTTTYTLPITQGTAGQVLSTDGVAGTPTLSWISPPSAPVASVHGRTGAVVGANGDYTASQVTNVAAGNIAATTTQAAIDELDSEKQSIASLAADVRAVVLTGLSTATNAVIAATDSVLVAFGKLQAQISANTTAVGTKADQTNVAQTITALTLTGLATPLAGTEAANKDYVDSFGQWTKGAGANVGDIYRSSGNVGIGTAAPNEKLDLSTSVAYGSVNSSGIKLGNSNDQSVNIDKSAYYTIKTQGNAAGAGVRLDFLHNTRNSISGFNGESSVMSFLNGNIGIGAISSGEKLEINGALKIGAANGTDNGTIRWTGSDFEGRKGGTWVSMTGANVGSISPVAFSVNKNGVNQIVASSTWVKLTMGNEIFDTNNNFASDRFTPTVAGKYFVNGGVVCTDNTSYCYVAIYKNGAIYSSNFQRTSYSDPNVTALVDMNGTTDYLEIYAFNPEGTTIGGATTTTYFSGFLTSSTTVSNSGSGSVDYVPYFTSSTALGNSPISVNSGKIGIGTTAPHSKLHVIKDITDAEVTGGFGQLTIGGETSPLKHLMIGYNTQSNYGYLQGNTYGSTWDNLVLQPKGGNVGIGIASPAAALDINGSSTAGGIGIVRIRNSYNSGGTKFWQIGPDGNGSGNFLVYNDANVGAFISYGQTTWSASSDRRLKKEIEPIEDGLNKVLKLNGVTYKYKKDTETDPRKAGVIAQDVQKVLPEAVTEQDGFLGVKYTELIGLLVESVKDLYHKVMIRFDSQDRAIASKANQSEVEVLKAENLLKDKKIKELEKRLLKIEQALSRK